MKKENHLEKLEFSSKDYKQFNRRGGKEVCIKGTWYDVQSVEKKGNNVICNLLKDEDETSLQLAFEKELQQHKKEKQNHFQVFYWIAILTEKKVDLMPQFFKNLKQEIIPIHCCLLQGHYKDLIKPPASL